MSSTDTDQLVMQEVQDHYQNKDSPYYLAELGKFFRLRSIEIPKGERFKDYLKNRFGGRLIIVQDADNPAKIAIAPPEKHQRVSQQLSGQHIETPNDSNVNYARLPLALIAAFCRVPPPGTKVYFRVIRPFRYEIRTQAPDKDYVEIEDRFRPTSLAGASVQELSLGGKQTIYDHIEKWASQNGIDLRELYYDRGAKSTGQTRAFTEANALQRLINAQEPGLRSRIRIPGDIASTLMQIP